MEGYSFVCVGDHFTERNSRTFDGVEWPNHVVKQMILKSVYKWMTVLSSIPPFFCLRLSRPFEFEIVIL